MVYIFYTNCVLFGKWAKTEQLGGLSCARSIKDLRRPSLSLSRGFTIE